MREGSAKANFPNDCTLIPDPGELNVEGKNLLILDDCLLGPHCKAKAHYTRGRHKNCDTIYIPQNYFRLPCQTIRENANFIILFQQDGKNLTRIYNNHCDDVMTIDELKAFCRRVWADKHNFVTLDLTSTKLNGKSRKSLDCFYLSCIDTFQLRINWTWAVERGRPRHVVP